MRNTNIGILMALLVSLSTGLAEATVAGESLPISLSSRDTTPLDQAWSSLRPAPKTVAQADDCPSVDVAALNGDALLNYLRTTSTECYEDFRHLYIFEGLYDLSIIFTDQNMQSVFKAIERLAPSYDGTNSTGMLQLWTFVRDGYWYHEVNPDRIGGPLNEATHRAHMAASKAFAASDHFFGFNDEAAETLINYFQTADRIGARQHHLEQVELVLSEMNPERGAWWLQKDAFGSAVVLLYRGLGRKDQGFIDALPQNPEIVDALLQATRYDFVNEDEFLLAEVLGVLGRLSHLASLEGAALTALSSVVMEQERFSNAFLVATKLLEDRVDCTSLNICRDVLERELHVRLLPNTYRFDDGALVFETPLDMNTVQTLYQAAKEVKAQFHRLLETDEPVSGAIDDVLHVKIYGSTSEYRKFQGYLSGADLGYRLALGYYENGTIYTYRVNLSDEPGEGIALEEKFRHEYAHYLADRFAPTGLYDDCLLTWFHEGLAEFLTGSTQAEGVSVLRFRVNSIIRQETRAGVERFDPAQIFDFCYSNFGFRTHDYNYSSLFFHFMHQKRRTQLLELVDMVRNGDASAYNSLIATWAGDTQLAADYSAFVDEQVANVDQLPYHPDYSINLRNVDPEIYPPRETTFHQPADLTSDSVAEIEAALQRINGQLNLDCRTVETESSPRFGCSGSLPAGSEFSGNQDEPSNEDQGESSLFSLFDTFADQAAQTSEGRGELNEHLNTRLDSFIVAAVEDGGINNFGDMTCYFANVAGSPPVADLYCEGPLRPTSANLAQSLTQTSREEQEGSAPQLQQNAPNPFNSQTVLSYFLHAPGPARLEVFSLTGQRVAVLHQGPQQAGYHRLRWNGRDDADRPVASGMYLYRLVTDEGILTRKLMLLR
ncbi:MAG: collagenase [Gemmatimonadota bacterium]|nr:collagenase [Gemmatimonadota bacterium]